MNALNLSDEDRERYAAVRCEALKRHLDGLDGTGGPLRKHQAGFHKPGRPAITPAVERFAETIFDKVDVGEVVTPKRAAALAGVSVVTAAYNIAKLRENKAWPYRAAQWRADLHETGRAGQFTSTNI